MICCYLFTLALDKAAAFPDFNNDRFVKELFKVFFTLLVKLQFVDIVKCVKNYKLLFLFKPTTTLLFHQCAFP